MHRLFFIFAFLIILSSPIHADPSQHAVTYTFSGGRFGDNLLAYLHAKWVSYHCGIQLLYKPFPYSDELCMHTQEKQAADYPYGHVTTLHHVGQIQLNTHPTLFVLPYFPESLWERKREAWGYIPVDWEDVGFRKELKRCVAPRRPQQKQMFPQDKITVAVHLRRGGGVDTENNFRHDPLKFPQDNFYQEELRWLSAFFSGHPLYVYLFTDDPEPVKLKLKYQTALSGYPIEFACREQGNAHNCNVVEDFFAMTQFDCSIHGESNFSVCAGKIADYMVEIQPTECHWEGDVVIIDKVTRKVRKTKVRKTKVCKTKELESRILK